MSRIHDWLMQPIAVPRCVAIGVGFAGAMAILRQIVVMFGGAQ